MKKIGIQGAYQLFVEADPHSTQLGKFDGLG